MPTDDEGNEFDDGKDWCLIYPTRCKGKRSAWRVYYLFCSHVYMAWTTPQFATTADQENPVLRDLSEIHLDSIGKPDYSMDVEEFNAIVEKCLAPPNVEMPDMHQPLF